MRVASQAAFCLNLKYMENPGQAEREADVQKKAIRAQRTLYILMCVLMLLPLVVAWLTGAFRV